MADRRLTRGVVREGRSEEVTRKKQHSNSRMGRGSSGAAAARGRHGDADSAGSDLIQGPLLGPPQPLPGVPRRSAPQGLCLESLRSPRLEAFIPALGASAMEKVPSRPFL